MCVLTTTSTFLALLALTHSAPVCEELLKPLNLEDLTLVMGKWWFLSGFCDHQVFTDILKVVNSSWITLTPSGQTGSLIMSQGNMLNGKCEFSTDNMTLKSSVLHVNQMFDGQKVTAEITILPSGSDYLTMKLKFKMSETTIRSLYLFGRSGKLSDTEQKAFQTQAECLGYSGPAPYTYNSVTELCDQNKLICKPLVEAQKLKDVTQFMGRWVLLMGFVDEKPFIDQMKITSSSWMDLEPTTNNKTIAISQGDMLNGRCFINNSNGTISNRVFYASGQGVTTSGLVLHWKQIPSSCTTSVTCGTTTSEHSPYLGGQVKHRPKIWSLSRSKLSVWDGSEQPIILTMELQSFVRNLRIHLETRLWSKSVICCQINFIKWQ